MKLKGDSKITNQKDEKNFMKYFIILTILMLFGAIAEWPYGYYTILRWITVNGK